MFQIPCLTCVPNTWNRLFEIAKALSLTFIIVILILRSEWIKITISKHLHCKQRNLFLCQVTPGNNSGSTTTCRWLWSEGMLPAWYWPVWKFGLILAISVLASVAAHHLLLFKWKAIAFRIFVFSESVIIFSMFCTFYKSPCAVLFHSPF